MQPFISSLADNASVHYKGRAEKIGLHNNDVMEKDSWQTRLASAIEASGKSKRQVSLDSGNGPGYVHSILTEGKDPTITKLIGVCRAIPVSPLFVIHGVKVTPEQQEVITALEAAPELTQNILAILGRATS